jgi:hypothetical protein
MRQWGDDIDYPTFEKSAPPLTAGPFSGLLGQMAQDQRSQGWEDPRRFRHCILRQFFTSESKIRNLWMGVMAIDEAGGVIYVQAQG